jgi:hypothetical protein
MRLALTVAAALALAGCSLTLDADGVKLKDACVPAGCAGKACGYDDCGNVCTAGSGCVNVHAIAAGRVGAAGPSSAASGHSVEAGLSVGAAALAAPAGHAVDGGTISQ